MMALSPDLLFAMLFNPGRIGVIAALPEELQSLLDAMPDAEPVERAGIEVELLAWLREHGARVLVEELPPGARRVAMNRVNPLYVPRNYLAQQAIDAAESGDTAELETLLEVLRRPYDEQPGRERFAARRPDWARDRPGCSMLSCSS